MSRIGASHLFECHDPTTYFDELDSLVAKMTDQDKANCDAYFAELDAKMAKMTAQDKADSDAYFAKLDAQVTKINPQDKAACDAYSKKLARMRERGRNLSHVRMRATYTLRARVIHHMS
jgi:hypothetical protein